MPEKIAIDIFVETFFLLALIGVCFFLKKPLELLKAKLMSKNKYVLSSLFQAVILPLKTFLWFCLIINLIRIAFFYFELRPPYVSKERIFFNLIFLGCSFWFLLLWKNLSFNNFKEQAQKKRLANFHYIDVLDKLVSILIIFIFLMLFLDLTGQNIGTLLTIGGIGAAAIGLAAKELVTNCFGGFMIYLNSPFYVGDVIELSGKGIKGKVEEISWYVTKIRDDDKQSLIVPNALFFQFIVINLSRKTHRRFKENIFFKIKNFSQLSELLKAIKECVKSHPKYDSSEDYFVNFTHANEDFFQITFSFYAKKMSTPEYYNTREKLLFSIYHIVENSGAQLTSDTPYANYKRS